MFRCLSRRRLGGGSEQAAHLCRLVNQPGQFSRCGSAILLCHRLEKRNRMIITKLHPPMTPYLPLVIDYSGAHLWPQCSHSSGSVKPLLDFLAHL